MNDPFVTDIDDNILYYYTTYCNGVNEFVIPLSVQIMKKYNTLNEVDDNNANDDDKEAAAAMTIDNSALRSIPLYCTTTNPGEECMASTYSYRHLSCSSRDSEAGDCEQRIVVPVCLSFCDKYPRYHVCSCQVTSYYNDYHLFSCQARQTKLLQR